MLTLEDDHGNARLFPEPARIAQALRRSLTLEAHYPPLALAHALAAHLEGALLVTTGSVPKTMAATSPTGRLIVTVPAEQSENDRAEDVALAAGALYFLKLVPEDGYRWMARPWTRDFAKEFLR